MKVCRTILVMAFIFVLMGCSIFSGGENIKQISTNNKVGSGEFQYTTKEDARALQREFKSTEKPIVDDNLIRKYLYSLIYTGKFKELKEKKYLDHIDRSIRDKWAIWVDKIYD